VPLPMGAPLVALSFFRHEIVLDGIWLGHFEFTDLPATTEEELKMWFIYGIALNSST